ncbi:MAG: hypothetical protein ACR2LS_04525 [Thermomicrobiales bacterium]
MTLHHRFIHALVVALLLLGLGASGFQPVAAQTSGNSYVDAGYGWEISWDDDVWTTVDNPTYDLVLWNEGDSYVFFQNRDAWGNAPDCLDGRVDEVAAEDGVDDLEPFEDEDGDAVGASSNSRATATYSLTYTNPDAANARSIDRINIFDCRVLEPDEAVLAITVVTSADAYEDVVDAVDDLLSDLDIPETTTIDDEPTGTPDDSEATETPEDEEPTRTPEDEATSTPEEEESTATPDETEVSDEAPDPAEGVEGNVYTSPAYGYSVEWDEDVWTPNVTFARDPDRDTLVLDLVDLTGYVYFEAYDDYDGDPVDCLDGSSSELLDDPDVDDIEPYEDEDGDIVEGEEDGEAFVAYTFDFDGDAAAGYFACRTLVEDEAVLAISLVTLEDDFEDARAELDDLLDSLDLGDVRTTPTPEEEETRTPEDGEDTAGVNGNSYESPAYGYTLEWDEDLWEVDEERTAAGTRDVLVLTYVDGGTLYVEGYDAYDGDPADCLDGSSAEILEFDDVSNAEPLEDENGDIIAGEDDGVVFAAYSLDIQDTSAVAFFSCQTLVEDEAVLAFSVIMPEDVADEGLAAFMDVQASLELAADVDRGARTPTPEDEAAPTQENGDDSAGVNGNAYESPAYGFTFEWDEDVWEVDEASSEDGVDLLVLSGAASTVTFEAMEAFDGDAEACVAAAEDEIADRRGVEDVEILEDEDGPIVDVRDGYAYTYYGYTLEQRNGDTEEMYEYVECSALGDDASVLRTSQTAPLAYAEAELDALDELLEGVDLEAGVPVLGRAT